MKIAVAGGTGFVGSRLVRYLQGLGHQTVIISRSKPRSHEEENVTVTWQELEENPELLEGTDAIVNLSGATISKRWTPAYKKEILQSRTGTTERTAQLVNRLQQKPRVVVNSSGISYYGLSDTERFDESGPAKVDHYLAEVVGHWEKAADRIEGTRVVKLRVSLVLGTEGGALPVMALPYKLFGGGRVGSGRQYISWIHIDDICRLILFCIENEDISGPVNASTRNPITNDTFGRTLGKVLHRPHWFPVPAFVMKTLFGEMSTLLLAGQAAVPAKALEHGFVFKHSELEDALRALYRKPKGTVQPG